LLLAGLVAGGYATLALLQDGGSDRLAADSTSDVPLVEWRTITATGAFSAGYTVRPPSTAGTRTQAIAAKDAAWASSPQQGVTEARAILAAVSRPKSSEYFDAWIVTFYGACVMTRGGVMAEDMQGPACIEQPYSVLVDPVTMHEVLSVSGGPNPDPWKQLAGV
jgi:hypothetical protein